MTDTSLQFRCQDLIYRFWHALDHRRIEEVMSYLTPDARWQRERWCEGEADIRAALEARPPELRIRHVITNIHIDEVPGGFLARLLMVPQFAMAYNEDKAPFEAPPLAMIGDLTVKIENTDCALAISEIACSPVFQAAAKSQ